VEVYIGAASELEERVLLERMVLDKTSRIKALRALPTPFQRFIVIVAHKDYGIARVRVSCAVDCKSYTIWVPMVKEGSRADSRCLWGQVIDDSNNGVAGAVVRVYDRVGLPGGGVARLVKYQDFAAITDDSGRFWLYPPVDKREEKVSGLVPAGSKCRLTVEPPKGSKLLVWKSGWILMGREVRVELERGSYFRMFSFEDANGPVKDSGIDLCIGREGKDALFFDYEEIKNGAWLHLGRFSARISNRRDDVIFQSIDVGADSPERLVFRAISETVYHGRVLDGSTGAPLAGAFLIAERSHMQGASFALLDDNEWENLYALSSEPNLEESALEPVKKICSFIKMVRTNEAGYFEMRIIPSGFRILIFAQDYLAVKHWPRLGKDGVVEVPTVRLFPAATVVFESRLRTNSLVHFDWLIESEVNQPGWVEGLRKPCVESCLLMDKHLYLDRRGVHRCLAPSDVGVQIRMTTPFANQVASVTYPKEGVIRLKQGQEVDLGLVRFAAKVKVFVKVLDSAGSGVEGVGVSIWADGKRKEVPHFTDANGVAEFSVDPNSAGAFVAEAKQADANEPPLREVLPYSFGGPEDANNVYTLKLSDEMVGGLFGER